jgi:hypothetical protein
MDDATMKEWFLALVYDNLLVCPLISDFSLILTIPPGKTSTCLTTHYSPTLSFSSTTVYIFTTVYDGLSVG